MKMRLCDCCKKLFEETNKIKIERTSSTVRTKKCGHCRKRDGEVYEVYVCHTNDLSKAN